MMVLTHITVTTMVTMVRVTTMLATLPSNSRPVLSVRETTLT